jgi:hypothetical protein
VSTANTDNRNGEVCALFIRLNINYLERTNFHLLVWLAHAIVIHHSSFVLRLAAGLTLHGATLARELSIYLLLFDSKGERCVHVQRHAFSYTSSVIGAGM